ncbi:hypothetical protein O181_063291 [Austropuccinia psidii MF-1]|uniref:Uncharacterized protein n=1 Tax=Austropuccinia psidii MF-1 TaxID=1389203 RepID=A0A9Q3EJS0_9BASI|nr:hypothetical protein [Austropuccinia psidii MF-1]
MTKIKGKGEELSSVLIPEREIKSMSQITKSRSSSGKTLSSHKEQGDPEREERSTASFDISCPSENNSYFDQDELSALPKELQILQFFLTNILATKELFYGMRRNSKGS